MKLKEIKEILEAELLTDNYDPEMDISLGASSDLMSDILAFGKPGSILLTSLNNLQAINTANVADIKVVCFVQSKIPNESIINLANRDNITVFITKLTMFVSCGKLFQSGLEGCNYLTFEE
ncbi:MAG: hypothetical protein KAS62_07265 [Candidatus Delongbacteria bacterium]|nr:hypothetical protein [Candidatus Delongbacteria bacterium]